MISVGKVEKQGARLERRMKRGAALAALGWAWGAVSRGDNLGKEPDMGQLDVLMEKKENTVWLGHSEQREQGQRSVRWGI